MHPRYKIYRLQIVILTNGIESPQSQRQTAAALSRLGCAGGLAAERTGAAYRPHHAPRPRVPKGARLPRTAGWDE